MKLCLSVAAFVAVSCAVPPEVPQNTCRALAVERANGDADALCSKYQEWDQCPDARPIEDRLLSDLERCDE